MLPLDTHAHIEPNIAADDLATLRACVIAVTRTIDDYETTLNRTDPSVVWAVGCHPGLAKAVRACSPSRLRDAIQTTPVVGETGLDGAARTKPDEQLAAFRQVLEVTADSPRLLSIHSYRATDLVLRELQTFRPQGAILHWWLGTPSETETAVELGALFSVNASQARRWSGLDQVPTERLLPETDHPFGDKSEAQPRRPGNTTVVENTLSKRLGVSPDDLRDQMWRNLLRTVDSLNLAEMFPDHFQRQFLATPR